MIPNTNTQALQVSGLAPKVATPGATTLPAKVISLSVKQPISDMVRQTDTGQSITVMNPGTVSNAFNIPSAITVTLTAAGAAVGATSYIFNNGFYNAATANITQTYSDKFNGNNLAQLFTTACNGAGVLIYGFNISGLDAAGAPSDLVVNASAPSVNYYNGLGGFTPNPIILSGSQRNTQYKSGLLTVQSQFLINATTQISCVNLLATQTLQFVFFTQPIM